MQHTEITAAPIDNLSIARALVAQMSDQELVTLAYNLLGNYWCAPSDRTCDIFYDAFNALDKDCAAADFDLIECELARPAHYTLGSAAA